MENNLLFRKLWHILFLSFVLLLLPGKVLAQISVTSTGTAFTQNFDSMLGTSGTATLTTNQWRGSDNAVLATWTGANRTAVTQSGGTAAAVTAGGMYNLGDGPAASATDRCVGWLSSASNPFTAAASTPLNYYAQYSNSTGNTINQLSGSFTIEKYRNGTNSAGFKINFYYSLDGSSWTNVTSGNDTFTADGNTNAVLPAGTTNKTFSITGLNITNGSNFYLRWAYSVITGSTGSNAMALGIDNVSLTATATATATITASSATSPTALSTTYGSVSGEASFSVSGANMNAGILVTPPSSNFEVSLTSGGTFANTVTVGGAGAISSTTVYIRLKGAAPAGLHLGNIVLSSTGATSANVSILSSTVSKKPLTIAAVDQSAAYGTAISTITANGSYTSSGYVNGDTSAVIGGSATYSTTYTNTTNAAAPGVTITPIVTALTATNYSFTAVAGNITVTKASQTISLSATDSKTYGAADYSPATSATSGTNAISYSSSNASVATIVSGLIRIVGTGTTTITASQAGSTNYSAAADATQTLTVHAANQSITFASTATKIYGAADYSPGATSATSGINVISYSSNNSAVATIVSGNIHIVGAGSATITASQGGSANYNAATDATQTLTVTAKALTVTGLTADNKSYDGATAATLSGTGSLSGVVSGDESNVTLLGTPVASFASSAVGSGILVTVTGYSLTGSAAGNYTLTSPTFTADIIATTPTIFSSGSIGAVSTTYGTASPTPASFEVSGQSLVEGVLITAPSGYEMSTNIGSQTPRRIRHWA